MAVILGIETATEVCSVSLMRDGNIIALKESSGNNEHSQLLTTFIQEVINESGIVPVKLDAVAVSQGPGSYTGLRIGVSAAKGLCYSLDLPLISVGTLKAMAWRMISGTTDRSYSDNNTLLCPMIDARRMEVYTAIYDNCLNEIRPVEAIIVKPDSFEEHTKNKRILIFGNGAEKCRVMLNGRENIHFINGLFSSAVAVASLAEEKFNNGDFEDTAYFEPFYLKDFIAGNPVVKGLR